jgi:cell pole-organizing protein PopZ
MEEILASIRRIIAEGERETRDAAGAVGAAPLAPDAEAAGKESREAGPLATVAAEAEILVLTEMLQEDGSVVSLQPDSVPEASPAGAGGAAPEPATPPSGPTDMTNNAAASPAAAEVTSADAANVAPASTTSTLAQPIQEVERSPLSGEGSKKTDLVSEATLEASTAALAQLAQSVGRTREASGSSRTVEEVVREAVEPMLKQWLDTNLSRIVERMVREAIERVVRRVE